MIHTPRPDKFPAYPFSPARIPFYIQIRFYMHVVLSAPSAFPDGGSKSFLFARRKWSPKLHSPVPENHRARNNRRNHRRICILPLFPLQFSLPAPVMYQMLYSLPPPFPALQPMPAVPVIRTGIPVCSCCAALRISTSVW